MKTKRNIMGTVSFTHKFVGMRKEQDFICYPMNVDSEDTVTVQSDTRIGKIDLRSGKVIMSQSHSGGAYMPHLITDKMIESELDPEDLFVLKGAIRETAGVGVGDSVVKVDNIGALFV